MAVCAEEHMSIGQAVRCGCARKEYRELWESDIVSNPDLFFQHGVDDVTAITAYTSTKTTNRVPTPVAAGRADNERRQTSYGSVRLLGRMSSGMGQLSDLHLLVAIGTWKAGDNASCFCPGYSGCVTEFHAYHSENRVATCETRVSRKSTSEKTVPHLRFPGACLSHGVQFPNNRVIVPVCGTLENAVTNIPPFNPDRDVPIGYSPSRWQGVVDAYNKLRSALTVSRADENESWGAIVARAVNGIAARHRTRGVSIPRDELSHLLTEMAASMSRERPQLDPAELDALCRTYATKRPPMRKAPADLTKLTYGAMRNRRTIMCHNRIPI